ncbi:SsgA family sporulation/cell division regulator [Kitasatospora sp. NPDC088391]|uniref:SsgA family sporulation/cell division regulator n=1 Tax=Kitasatospora sp. NPDC088391 TaxID=3364074 RepID=UPI003805CA53
MFAAPVQVEQTTHARLIVSAHLSAGLRVTLRYRSDDPLAVRMLFPAEYAVDGAADAQVVSTEPEIEWVFARQLLAEGLDVPSGEGDVHLRPVAGLRTLVELRSPDGVALLRFERAGLRRFLWSSYLAVPAGQELAGLDYDRALADLLA